MKPRPRYFCGPWVGEFGWELVYWQGYLRKYFDSRRQAHVTVACERDHEYLYRDFAHEFQHHDAPVQSRNGFFNTTKSLYRHPLGYDHYVSPFHTKGEPQRFVRLGAGLNGQQFDCMVHARSSPKGGDLHKNWCEESWNALTRRLVEHGFTVGAYGSVGHALCPSGATDMRREALTDVCGALAATQVSIGTTSGGMNLASLCGTPTVIWGGGRTENWAVNQTICSHFDAPFTVVSQEWQPSVDEVWAVVLPAVSANGS